MERTFKTTQSHSNLAERPIFIVGAQRSGTTLLRLMLNNHSEIAIPEEGTFWMPLLRQTKKKMDIPVKGLDLENYLKYIERNTQFKLWGINPDQVFKLFRAKNECRVNELMTELYHLFAVQNNKKIWGDKTPSFFRMIPTLSVLFPNARFVHVVRDGRDLYLSWKKMDPTKSNIAVAAIEWSYKVGKASSDLEKYAKGRYVNIQYEDLVKHPKTKLFELFDFLELNFEEKVLEYWKSSNKFIGNHHSNLIFQPVSTKSINKWEKKITKREICIFNCIAGRTLQDYGYKILTYKENMIIIFSHIALLFFIGLPYRCYQVLSTRIKLGLAARLGLESEAAGKGKAPDDFSDDSH